MSHDDAAAPRWSKPSAEFGKSGDFPLHWFLLLAFASACLVTALLLPGLSGDFVFDDKPNLIQNEAVHITRLDVDSLARAAYSFQPGGGSRPLAELTFAIDYWRAGLDPAAFKATNLAIHALTTIALCYLYRMFLLCAGWSSRRAAWFAIAMATVWAAHPLQVSSVMYAVQRMQTLGTLFTVLALASYVSARQAQQTSRASRGPWIVTLLFGTLALASKEDAILLPAYTLALELTVLRFTAASTQVERRLRVAYSVLALLGAAIYLFIVLPHYWHSGNYPGRDFSTAERLLTQTRVLIIYLGQIVWPSPQHLPFYYDGLAPSRGILEPATTLFSIIALASLIAVAWRSRFRHPLFALGIFLFLAGHALTSNVVGLELAFEHRNHFPLVGAILALADMFAFVARRARLQLPLGLALCSLLFVSEAAATVARARLWGDPMQLASTSTVLAPDSARAWLDLCGRNYELSARKRNSPYLDRAINACESGSEIQYSAALPANVVLFKTIRGDATAADWNRYLDRMQHAPMSEENKHTVWVMLGSASAGVPLDNDGMLKMLDIASQRIGYDSVEYARIGYFILDRTQRPGEAYAYLSLSVQAAAPGSRLVPEMLQDLRARGRGTWSAKLETLARSHGKL